MNAPAVVSRDAGFTLLELLVSLALLSLLMAMMSQALYNVRQANRAGERAGSDAAVGSVRMVLSRIISEARPIRSAGSQHQGRPLIDGREDRLRLVTSFSAGGAFGGLNDTQISLQSDKTGKTADLVVDQALFRQPGSQFGTIMPRPLHAELLRNVTGLTFRYFGVAEFEGNARWHKTWRYPSRLPTLIEISLALPVGDTRVWPPLSISLAMAER